MRSPRTGRSHRLQNRVAHRDTAGLVQRTERAFAGAWLPRAIKDRDIAERTAYAGAAMRMSDQRGHSNRKARFHSA